MKTITALLTTLLICLGTALSLHEGESKSDRSLICKTVGEVTLELHVFEPTGLMTNDHRPTIVFFFGGGWSSGDAKQFSQHARVMAEQGMVAFLADYRVKSRNQATPFECVQDAKSAIRWVRERAAELGVDPNRIVASGGSAGGHIAACTSLIAGGEEASENLKINPALDTTGKGYGAKNFIPAQQTELSPAHQLRKGIPPTIVFHGTIDQTVPYENAERFTRLMKEAGNDCVLVPFPGRNHGFFTGSFFRPQSDDQDFDLTTKHAIEFLTKHGCLPAKK